MTKLAEQLKQFGKAIHRFEEILAVEKNDIVRDSAIQRFEFSFELAWKTVKEFLEERKGIIQRSPKDCFREAYRQKLIDHDDSWIAICDMRNYATHAYDEQLADYIYHKLPKVLASFKELYDAMKREVEEVESGEGN